MEGMGMVSRYQFPLFYEHTVSFAESLRNTQYSAIGEEILVRLRHDQHDNNHDDEFVDGCDYCDKQREDYE
jgi:hypothetical protein